MSLAEYIIGFIIGAAFTALFIKGPRGDTGPMGIPGQDGRDAK